VALLSRLFLLLAVALLPAIAIQSYNEFDLRRSRQMEVQEQALGLAKLAAAEQQQVVEGIRQVLIALSELPAVKAKDPRACSAYLMGIKQRYPAFIAFIVVDMNGQSFCTTSGRTADVAGRADFADATRTGEFAVGGYSIGVLTGIKLIPFALPFYDDEGHMAGAIITAISLDWLAKFIVQMAGPPGATLAITDRDGTYLARYPDNDRFVGRKMPRDQYVRVDHPGTTTTRDIDGVEQIVGYAPLQAESGGLFVTYGLNKAQAFGEIQRRTRRGVLLIVLSTSLVLVLTWFGARRFIHRPLAQLVDAANHWRLGDFARRVHIQDKCSEIAGVAGAFNAMADALEERERELYHAKEKAEEAAARITTIFESTTECVLLIDRNWSISYLNERAKAQISEDRDLIGMNLWHVFPDADTDTEERIHKAMSEQHLASFEAFFPLRASWRKISAFPSGEGLAVFSRDITAHKHALEARRQIEEQLHQSQKMEAVGQLTGGVAHDFNNLLMVISGNLDLIDDRAADTDSVRGLVAAARKAADRGAKLIAQLLAFSRRQTLNPKSVHAGALIRDFQDLLRRAIGEGCDIKLVAEDQLWLCLADPAQLETTVLNLALNGRDAMPRGGTLEIEVRNVTLRDGAIAGVAAGPYVRLSVKDTGCGIAPEILDRVFEPFFTTKEVGRGTGLGLSMVYGFVRQSGGHVTIESKVGVGTTISLYLPKSTQMPAAVADTAQIRDVPAGSGRILMVEDDDDVLDVTSALLRQLGYQVLCTRNGTEALRILKAGERFDLLFSDVVMPQGINGVELAREARRLCSSIKVLLTSGNAADVLARHRAEDEFPIIGKPYRRADLAQYLRLVMRGA
jgi:signal transduction histidine kinase/CheY-like chemotaxis protein/HAMP domain-containing protein